MKKFLLILFLLCGSAIQGYAQRPRISQMTLTERIAYDMYKDEIMATVTPLWKEQYAELCRTYKFPKAKREDMIKYVCTREIRKQLYNYIYPNDTEKRLEAKNKIDTLAQDSIDATLLLYNDISGVQTSRSIKLLKDKISKERHDSLISHAIIMCRKKRANPSIDLHDEDIATIQKFLPEKYFNSIIRTYNNVEANRKTDEIWQKLKENNYTSRYDSVQTWRQIFRYVHKELFIETVYKNKSDLQKQALRALAPERPEAFRTYKSILVREELERKQKREKERESSSKPQPVF